MVRIIENDDGTIKADVSFSGIDIDEICLEAEVEKGDPGDINTMPRNSTCEITRVFVRVKSDYEQNLDITQLYEEVKSWEKEIIEEIEKENV